MLVDTFARIIVPWVSQHHKAEAKVMVCVQHTSDIICDTLGISSLSTEDQDEVFNDSVRDHGVKIFPLILISSIVSISPMS